MTDQTRVLYVDDEQDLLEIAKIFLEENGDMSVDTVSSAREALDSQHLLSYHAIVSDFEMPGMNGIEFLRAVRDTYGDIPFILFTGRGREEVVIHALNEGADFYLQKGGEMEAQFTELAHKIRQAIRRKSAEDNLKRSEERYRTIVNDQTELIVRFDQHGMITLINPAYQNYIFRWRGIRDVVGKNFREVIGKTKFEAELWRDISSLTPDNPVSAKNISETWDDGSVHWYQWIVHAFFSPGGIATEFQAIGRDITDLKNKEIELQKSEERFRFLVETSPNIIWTKDVVGEFRYVSPAVKSILGYTPDEFRKISLPALLTPEGKTIARKLADQVRSTKIIPKSFEIPTYHRDGSEVVLEIRAGLPAQGDDPQLFRGVAIDVTERKRAEDRVRESESRFATLFQENPVALTLVSLPDGKFVDVNKAFTKYSGYSREEVIGKTSREKRLFVDEKDYERVKSAFSGGQMAHGRLIRCQSKDGRIRTCQFKSSIIRMNGTPHILSSIEDITEQKDLYDALAESRERFSQVAENAGEWIWEIDADGLYTYCSPGIEKILGYRPEELVGRKHYYDLFVPDEQEKLHELVKGMFQQKQPVRNFVNRNLHRTGKIVYLESSGSPVLDADGTLLGYRGADLDITERVMADEALKQVNRKLSLLSQITRHDIRNQLLSLNGFVRLLRKRNLDPGSEDFLVRIQNASSRIANLIQFTKEYESVGVISPSWHELRSLVENATRDILNGSIVLENHLPQGQEIFADPLVSKVFFNLADNAVRHGDTITSIRFLSEKQGGDLVIICEDDGCGVPVEDKALIFDLGFGKNTGYGLALSKDILDITGITIRENGEPGKGARFEIRVPSGAWRNRGGKPVFEK